MDINMANRAAVYNVYLYLAYKINAARGETLGSLVRRLEEASRTQPYWKPREFFRLNILKNALGAEKELSTSKIGDSTVSVRGLTACAFTAPDGQIFVAFKGTGKGEWIDNGEGLSGVPEENTYMTYGQNGRVISNVTVKEDLATDQQVEALNWFNYISAKNGWKRQNSVILSGHSKGGNKAQFVMMHTDTAACYSFDGQGFSPEALSALKDRTGRDFETRRRKIYSLSADNDYINVLGQRLMPEENVYYFRSDIGYHYLESMLDDTGRINPPSAQGELSRYIESVSAGLMRLPPHIRQYATRGIMNILQKTLGRETPVNGDAVSFKDTVAGLAVAVNAILGSLPGG